MTEGAVPVAKPPPPVDNTKMLGDLKIKLMHMKRNLLGLKVELRNRAELWEAALDEIEQLESMAKDAKDNFKKQREQIREDKKKAAELKRKDREEERNKLKENKEKDKEKEKDDKKEELMDEKEGTDDEKKEEN